MFVNEIEFCLRIQIIGKLKYDKNFYKLPINTMQSLYISSFTFEHLKNTNKSWFVTSKMNRMLGIIVVFVLIGVACAREYECTVNGRLYPDVYNCKKYMECNFAINMTTQTPYGKFIERDCAAGTEFNAKLMVCIFL